MAAVKSTEDVELALDDLPGAQLLAPGLTFQRLYEGQILAFRFSDITRPSIDAWAERCTIETLAIPVGHHSYAIHDFSGCKIFSITPYLRERGLAMARQFHEMTGYGAIIVPKTAVHQLAALFLRLLKIKLQTRIFFTYEEGLQWLVETVERDRAIRS